jgi:hypothetical protein
MKSKRSLSFCLSFCILHSAFCIGVAAAEPDLDAKPAPRGLLSGLFSDKSKSRAKADKAALTEDKPAPRATVAMDNAELQRQWNAALRRMEVCDRLRRIAFQTDNEALMRQADELEARAREVYNRQTACLSMPARVPESPAQSDDKKAAWQTSRAGTANDKALDEAPPTPQQRPTALDRLGGNFEQREQSILNSTSMGRDKP